MMRDASAEPPTGERAMAPVAAGALELRGPASGLLDDHILMRVRGAGPGTALTWRARYRDDDGRVWRSAASRCEDLATGWSPGKEGTGAVAALRSLRPVSVDVRAETADGRSATRTLTRRIAADGVRTRRWRDGVAATLHVPARPDPCATVIIDATTGAAQATVATLAAPLLASRGVLALVVVVARGRTVAADPLAVARERLSAVPAASTAILLLSALDPLGEDETVSEPGDGAVVLPPGVGVREARAGGAVARAAAWDTLLQRLGARPRERPIVP
ncbi:MAG: hypothetical protein QOJ63_3494 [Solirubrobacteraceae bacterium]|nr:hypothetical protein [Solirubrobacteraceae bacterium]